MKPKHQRLVLLGLALAAMAGALALGISALGTSATYFYAPSDVFAHAPAPGEAIRLGGLVQKGSVQRLPDGLTLAFRVTDNARDVPVRYTGIVPDLFREGQGVITEGHFDAQGTFIATSVLAKHDEKYMPPEVAGSLHKVQGKVTS
ncbi:cytochrome c maturation protein CcmE [Polymorphobacter arshaanensis]|uniref:Cytochrome c-type biogenesis protein CcmE n=1 Tax=Glacieibacterium arshaanense TaxID=2511025 RepID=A0A4Y9EMB6_9SPHN|nr:cytochrome c maturation protein CcmE [Polymorphobacter arshaanensis]TFU01500.1 cytochrome c maturation protein CcmE [Polymorphobacter arshaanensis]